MDFRLTSEEFPNCVPSEMAPLQEVFCHFASHSILLQSLDFAISSFIYCFYLTKPRYPCALYTPVTTKPEIRAAVIQKAARE